jgi:hypothetical protein
MVDALDSDSRRCTPGYARYALTTWTLGDAAPRQRPPYYNGVPDTRLRTHRAWTSGGVLQPSFSLTLTQDEVDGGGREPGVGGGGRVWRPVGLLRPRTSK